MDTCKTRVKGGTDDMTDDTQEKKRQFYTVEEIHEITGLSKPTIYRGVDRKKIPSFKVCGAIRIPKWWIDQFASPPPETVAIAVAQ